MRARYPNPSAKGAGDLPRSPKEKSSGWKCADVWDFGGLRGVIGFTINSASLTQKCRSMQGLDVVGLVFRKRWGTAGQGALTQPKSCRISAKTCQKDLAPGASDLNFATQSAAYIHPANVNPRPSILKPEEVPPCRPQCSNPGFWWLRPPGLPGCGGPHLGCSALSPGYRVSLS